MSFIRKHKKAILLLGILLIGANLRAPITSIGVAIPNIKIDLHLSNSVISLLTIMPLLAFAIASLFAAKTVNRIGLERTMFIALILIVIGLLTRTFTNTYFLLIGTLLVGIGNAYGNVLTPAIIKGRFPRRIGVVTALYTVVMNLCGALSSFITAPLLHQWHYNIVLNLVILVTLFTMFVWVFQLDRYQLKVKGADSLQFNVWKSTLAWQITLFIGSQSLIFYSFLNWLPEYLSSKKVDLSVSGTYLTILQLCLIPMTFVTPMIIEKMRKQNLIIFISGLLFIIGTLLVMFNIHLVLLGVIFIGVASGISFGIFNTFFAMKTESSVTAAKLSGMAQAVGYLIAAVGPLLFGILHELTHTWLFSFILLIITACIIMTYCTRSGRKQTVEGELRSKGQPTQL